MKNRERLERLLVRVGGSDEADEFSRGVMSQLLADFLWYEVRYDEHATTLENFKLYVLKKFRKASKFEYMTEFDERRVLKIFAYIDKFSKGLRPY